MQETFERSSSRPADRLERLFRADGDLRVREHLRRAESALRSAEYDLSPERRRRRERHLDRLAAYRERGEVPANRTEPERVPLFVGDDGTPCAMAHLLGEDGREDLVADVMTEEPTVRIEDLADDHPAYRWRVRVPEAADRHRNDEDGQPRDRSDRPREVERRSPLVPSSGHVRDGERQQDVQCQDAHESDPLDVSRTEDRRRPGAGRIEVIV